MEALLDFRIKKLKINKNSKKLQNTILKDINLLKMSLLKKQI